MDKYESVPIITELPMDEEYISLPLITTVSDEVWQLDCLLDRVCNPKKYERDENVEETIEKIENWLAEREISITRETISKEKIKEWSESHAL